MFCPECGKPLAKATQQSASEKATAPEVAAPGESTGAEHQPSPPASELPAAGSEVAAAKMTTRAAEIVRHGGEKTRERLHRASSVARGAIEDNVKRVEKIHHVSSVMFEEAHYDPSLRFVLVALGLFIVFIILLILSKVMG